MNNEKTTSAKKHLRNILQEKLYNVQEKLFQCL